MDKIVIHFADNGGFLLEEIVPDPNASNNFSAFSDKSTLMSAVDNIVSEKQVLPHRTPPVFLSNQVNAATATCGCQLNMGGAAPADDTAKADPEGSAEETPTPATTTDESAGDTPERPGDEAAPTPQVEEQQAAQV